jgi:hypothetical protein
VLSKHANNRSDAGNVPDRAIETEFTDEGQSGDVVDGNLSRCGKHPNRDGKVEPRPRLAVTRRSEVYRDSTIGPLEPRRHDCRPYAVARFAARLVGQTEHGETGQATPYVHLNRDWIAASPEQR